jgi:hypothetical protein
MISRWAVHAHSGKKTIAGKKIPELWSTNPLPTVSGRCKDMIEAVDPGVHYFAPIHLIDRATGDEYSDVDFYLMICGRLVEIDPAATAIASDKTDIFGLVFPSTADHVRALEARIYQAIVADSQIQTALKGLPLWRFNTRSIENLPFGSREILYANDALLDAAKKAKLSGFKETAGMTQRDVNHVWY